MGMGRYLARDQLEEIARAPVFVLLSTDWDRTVTNVERWAVPGVQQKPVRTILCPRAECEPFDRRPTDVSPDEGAVDGRVLDSQAGTR